MTNQPITYRMVRITRRLCSDKVQPHIQRSKIYFVRTQENINGTEYLTIFRPDNPKLSYRINSSRFEWQTVTHDSLQRSQDEQEVASCKKEILSRFTDNERRVIGLQMVIIAMLAFHYAHRCKAHAASLHLSRYIGVSRTISTLYNTFCNRTDNKCGDAVARYVDDDMRDVLSTFEKDFFILDLCVDRLFRDTCPAIADDPDGLYFAKNIYQCGLILALYQTRVSRINRIIAKRYTERFTFYPEPSVTSLKQIVIKYIPDYIGNLPKTTPDITRGVKVIANRISQYARKVLHTDFVF